jgi:hybrid cluster-associated redox disulfide protein
MEFDMSIDLTEANEVSLEMTMDDVISKSPEVITVLMKNRMHCVGCLLTPFHTISDAAVEHEIDEDALIAQLKAAGIIVKS